MRSRNLKPGFFTNEHLAECRPLARLLFAGLWCVADRNGLLEDRPKRLKAELLPYDDVDVDSLLTELHEHGFILRYMNHDGHYIAIVNFRKHQRPHIKERASTIQAPEQDGASTEQAPTKASTRTPDSLLSDSLYTDPLLPAHAEAARARAREEPASRPAAAAISSVVSILVTAPFVVDGPDIISQAVKQSFEHVPAFQPRDGPFVAEKFVRYYSKRKIGDWYVKWLDWIKREARDAIPEETPQAKVARYRELGWVE